jgi:hypothetical protein
MGNKYKVSFTDAEKEQFALMESFGVPIESLNKLLK